MISYMESVHHTAAGAQVHSKWWERNRYGCECNGTYKEREITVYELRGVKNEPKHGQRKRQHQVPRIVSFA
jgi:hypothetical protein